ncbi:MAG: hypothetical protein ISS83_01365 [Candidatus Pacebacteria bacterium]|nr:hypothetical protein [Candidatus Paceibacterota bacterium]
MANKEKTNSKDILFKESLRGVKNDIRLTLAVLAACMLLALTARFIFGVPLSNFIFLLFSVWILFYLSHGYFIKRKKNHEDLYSFHFKNNIFDVLFLTVVIHHLGGVEWIGAVFYLCILAWASSVLSKKKVFVLCLASLFCYFQLATLEYFGILPHREVFSISQGAYQDPVFILIQTLTLTIAFLFIAENYGTLSENLRKKQEKLIKAQEEIEEAKDVLEIKVDARTRELQELTKEQEGTIQERTREIQEKLEDMERFQKLSVGRELKMIELKKEIKRLEEKLKEIH